MKFFLFLLFLSSNVFALAVTPSSVDFTNSRKAHLFVFNTEDYVKDFSLTLTDSGFSVDRSLLTIPPRSSMPVNVSSSCTDCESRLYVREISNSQGIKVEPAVVIKLSSGEPEDKGQEYFDGPLDEVESFSFFNLEKPEAILFLVVVSVFLAASLFFLGRKFYIKKLFKKLKRRKKK